MSQSLYVWGGKVVTVNRDFQTIEDGVLHLEDGKILSLESNAHFQLPPGAQGLDARGKLVMPGLINGHAHSGMTLFRGIADDLPLERWLAEAVFVQERRWASPEFTYWSTLLACYEMLRGGITTCNDMYYFQASAAKAFHEAGMRAFCGQTIVDISGVEPQGDIEAMAVSLLEHLTSYPLLMPALTPHSVYGASEKTWRETIRVGRKYGVCLHTHLSETKSEVACCMKEHGDTPTQILRKWGAWEIPVSVAHAVELTPQDISVLVSQHVGVVHNPGSNLKLGSGICPVSQFLQQGGVVGLGTDSTASNNDLNLWEEAKLAALLQSLQNGAGSLTTKQAVAMLTRSGAEALGIGALTGSLEPGKAADLIVLDLDSPHCVPLYDPYSHLTYSVQASDVRHVVIAGKIVVRDFKVLTLNEAALLAEARSWARRITKECLPI